MGIAETAPAGKAPPTEQQVIERAQEVVALLDAGDYETLQSMSIDEMKVVSTRDDGASEGDHGSR